KEGSLEPTQRPLPPGVSALPVLERCIEEACKRFGYGAPCTNGVSHGHLKRGIGIASGFKNVGYSFGFPEQATATVELFGKVSIEHAVLRIGAADVGQGAHLILRQICAETLAVDLERVQIVAEDSGQSPDAGSASASRMTFMGGRAVSDAASAALAKFPGPDARATVQYRPSATTGLDPITTIGRPNYCYGYVCQAVEVEVNILTGQVQILRIISAHDVGKAINRQQVEGQIEGCLAQAVGYTITEHLQLLAGKILTPHFSTYLLPTTLDMPTEVYPILLELADHNGPFGARGVAEMPLIPFAAAVAIAIQAATGAWVSQLPMTPERVLAAIIRTRGEQRVEV
ncbi:MAG: molybdopterin cofactor-binding domain-containing protein, partial [Candidatus Baltobacteraceae bacterium]